jgi:hypothetical protein
MRFTGGPAIRQSFGEHWNSLLAIYFNSPGVVLSQLDSMRPENQILIGAGTVDEEFSASYLRDGVTPQLLTCDSISQCIRTAPEE